MPTYRSLIKSAIFLVIDQSFLYPFFMSFLHVVGIYNVVIYNSNNNCINVALVYAANVIIIYEPEGHNIAKQHCIHMFTT